MALSARTLSLPDGSLHYERTGEGLPLLLIQGSGVCGSGWKPQIAELSYGFQCLSFDNRGVGRSTASRRSLTIEQMAQDSRALLNEVGWESAHVVGHSMGGLIAQQLALDVPERVRSLSLLCSFARGTQATRLTPNIVWMGLRTRIGCRSMRRKAFLRMLFTQEYLDGQNLDQLALMVGLLVGRDLADSPPIIMKQLGAMRRFDASARLSELSTIPTLVVSAERDPIALPVFGQDIGSRVKGSRYVEIERASHGVTIEMPEVVNPLIRIHLQESENRWRSSAHRIPC